jgi:hypothetical protein
MGYWWDIDTPLIMLLLISHSIYRLESPISIPVTQLCNPTTASRVPFRLKVTSHWMCVHIHNYTYIYIHIYIYAYIFAWFNITVYIQLVHHWISHYQFNIPVSWIHIPVYHHDFPSPRQASFFYAWVLDEGDDERSLWPERPQAELGWTENSGRCNEDIKGVSKDHHKRCTSYGEFIYVYIYTWTKPHLCIWWNEYPNSCSA